MNTCTWRTQLGTRNNTNNDKLPLVMTNKIQTRIGMAGYKIPVN